MATLTANINATTREIPTSAGPGFYTIGSENVHLVSEVPRAVPFSDPPTGRMYARRGVGDTTAASHSSGATLTRYDPEAPGAGVGGGSISATDVQGGSVLDVTTLQVPTVTAGVAGTAIVRSVIISDSDPGNIGPGNLWLNTAQDAFDDLANFPLLVRNETDDGWISVMGDALSAISLNAYSADGATSAGLLMSTTSPTINLTLFGPSGQTAVLISDVGGNPAVSVKVAGHEYLRILNNLGTSLLTFPDLPTVDPNSVGAIWNNAGVLTVSAG